jgi:hypothetical protein
MFIAALFTMANLWNQPWCPNDWIKKMWYIYTMEYYSVIKNEIVSFAGKCVELEIIMLSKISQAQKDKDHMFLLMWNVT